eukprot:TRINITY_DN5454_c0_g1_i2.p1 TRINITY_DN5454_c0_g1~~TRINITY_DN5454_c0_g1_i2.p1  ORF type:complete len:730 (-),score=236.58 TRINITY_DN5454_c0_g1_i2:76-2220(-)
MSFSSTPRALRLGLLLSAGVNAVKRIESESAANPVAKVIKLLTEMKTQVETEAKDDKDAYDKFVCWCTTNEKLKTADVEAAEKEISRLEVQIEEAAGLQGQLKTEISGLEDSIAEDQDALAAATAAREKENAAYLAEAKEMKETIATLKQAIAILAKVQGGGSKSAEATSEQPADGEQAKMLLQLKGIVKQVHSHIGQYRNVMQRDLWGVMDAIDEAATAGGFLPKGGKGLAALALRRQGQLQPSGAAAGAQSYNSRSGGVLGSLQAMLDEFAKDLASAEKSEAAAAGAFTKLRELKIGEINAAQERKASKEKLLADTAASAAQAKEDLEATMGALSSDQQVLATMGKNCKENEEGFAERSTARSEELRALGEAISILTEDDSRDLFGKTMSFLQTSSKDAGAETQAQGQTQTQAVDKAMRRLLKVAHRHKNWALASLAVNVRLDAFTKVKEAMDKMVAELKDQQQTESEKFETCKKEIDAAEDSLKVKGQEKEDLEGTKLGLANQIAALEDDIKTLRAEIDASKMNLKRAGEDRASENKVFQQSVADQRAAINVLQKAKARLAQFYASKPKALLQSSASDAAPGDAVAPPPPKSKGYSKSAGAGGVLQLMDMIIKDAASAESELVTSEQQANAKAVVSKTESLEQSKGEHSETEAAMLLNGEELEKLQSLEKSLHVDCDFLIKYYDARQQARSEEISAIGEAKAILSGADFGR